MRAVQFDRFGGIEELVVRDVPEPQDAPGRAIVAVHAAGINPGEISFRTGLFEGRVPTQFPSGQGSDLAGVVRSVGEGVSGVAVGDEVLGYTLARASHAELVSVPEAQLTPKPAGVSFEVAGSLYIAGYAASASVDAVAPRAGETIVVSGAAGGVGSLAAQLARRHDARVIGLASESNHAWLRSLDIEPIAYGEGLAERLREAVPEGVAAVIDTFGGGYVELALQLGVTPERINTIIDFDAVSRFGVRSQGTQAIKGAGRLAELAALVAAGELCVNTAATFPLEDVQAAFRMLEERHTRGKVVLIP